MKSDIVCSFSVTDILQTPFPQQHEYFVIFRQDESSKNHIF
jgi:hypothetical protein